MKQEKQFILESIFEKSNSVFLFFKNLCCLSNFQFSFVFKSKIKEVSFSKVSKFYKNLLLNSFKNNISELGILSS